LFSELSAFIQHQYGAGHLVAPALCQVTSAVLGDHRPDLCPVFLEFCSVGNDVLGTK
jgi:hypothetical protein